MNPATPVATEPSVARLIPFPPRLQRPRLSVQERACLELAANGHDVHKSSRLLSASASTFVPEESVRSAQMRARRKLKARSLAHAVAIALHSGLVELHGQE